MTRWFWSRALAPALLLLVTIHPAGALKFTDIPAKFGIPWAGSAGGAYVRSIPTNSQIGIQNCAASLTDGFPPLTFVPASGGGCPPFGQDFNGILKQLSQWSQWQAAGGVIKWDSAFSASIGGYPQGAVVDSNTVGGRKWLSIVNDNVTNPDADGAGWVQDPSQVLTGTPVPSLSTAIPFGYVSANGLTIGNAGSNATGLAGSETQFLFGYVWNNCPSSVCAIYTSTGVGTSRGASAAADFAASKAIATYNLNGAGMVGADSQNGTSTNNLAGVPVQSGATTVPGSTVGENLHALTSAENGPHAHANSLTDPGHSHANTLADPGHVHTNSLTDPGHAHANTLADPGHSHASSLTDPGHVHAVPISDPGHFHTNSGITRAQFNISTAGVGPFLYGASIGGGAGTLIDSNVTGITASASSHATGVTINNASASTGMSVNNASASTGITSSALSHATGVTISNVPNFTGLSISNAGSGSGAGHNTVLRSMIVYWLLKL